MRRCNYEMSTDYAKKLNELAAEVPDAFVVMGGTQTLSGELFSIARALLAKNESLKASYDDCLGIADGIGIRLEQLQNSLRGALKDSE